MLNTFPVFFIFAFGVALTHAVGGRSYDMWCIGKCDHDKATATEAGVVLMGGGADTTEAFEWQVNNANGGDFVILRASGDDAYNDWVMEISILVKKPLNSVTTILFNKASAAGEPEVLSRIQNAEAIFFAGGDQGDYMSMWVGTEVQSIIQGKLNTTTVGGTSAGLAILGNWVYTSEHGSAESETVMQNPYDRSVSIAPAFLNIPFLETVITDTHFVTRDRMGRMLTFVARIVQDFIDAGGCSEDIIVRGVGVDEHTALLLNATTGGVTAVGANTAYVCTPWMMTPAVCHASAPLTYTDIACVRLSASKGDTYSFASFGGAGVSYTNAIEEGSINPLHYGPEPVH